MLRIRRAGLPAQARSVFAEFRFSRAAILLAFRLLGADSRTVDPRPPLRNLAQGLGGSSRVRTIESPDPVTTAGRFFSLAGKGGAMATHKDGAVTVSSFGARFRIVFRPRSSSDGSPVVEIYSQNLPGKHPAYQKIHLTRRNP